MTALNIPNSPTQHLELNWFTIPVNAATIYSNVTTNDFTLFHQCCKVNSLQKFIQQ